MESSRGILRFLEDYRSSIVICGAPTFFLPLLFFFPDNEKQAQCAYVVSIMGFYWMFEVLPLAITALIPMVAFPFFEIMKSEDVAQAYLPVLTHVSFQKGTVDQPELTTLLKDTSFLFIGGLMVAVAVEKSELHTRIALFVLKTVGSRPKWIMAGFMGVTGFLSMWISNTATAALMVPIVQSVITELVTNHRMHEILALSEVHSIENRRRSVDMRRLSIPQENVLVAHQKDMSNLFTPREHLMAKGLLISVCFAANIGGSATITGTASNLVLLGQLEKLFPNADTGINFLSWITFAFPQAVLCLAFCWFVLNIVFLRNAPQGSAIVSRKLKEKYDKLPSTTFAEVISQTYSRQKAQEVVFTDTDKRPELQVAVMVCFVLLLGLWMLREPQIIPGFGAYFKRGYITDATSAVFVVLLLFIIPDKKPMCYQRDRGRSGHYTVRNSLLDWPTIQERFPWSVVLLLGGGFALAAGVKAFAGFFVTIGCVVLTMLNVLLWGRTLFTLNDFPLWAYDDDHPMNNLTLIAELLAQNKTVYPDLPFAI
ncbi:sodium:sulfate symporter transmembrane region [Necator americanus]|uniref:Sodium:sulfate symporter transmembrane region n=1 Tax=Necator americanus TaxID=51031 RepID=W2T6U1_NECAM|nr:sodium:sulfate symporter transmembrane region [Necator americanus]ETN76871.1 sodium:sulfate symporter transmembrane region [Necator americanus]